MLLNPRAAVPLLVWRESTAAFSTAWDCSRSCSNISRQQEWAGSGTAAGICRIWNSSRNEQDLEQAALIPETTTATHTENQDSAPLIPADLQGTRLFSEWKCSLSQSQKWEFVWLQIQRFQKSIFSQLKPPGTGICFRALFLWINYLTSAWAQGSVTLRFLWEKQEAASNKPQVAFPPNLARKFEVFVF